MHYSSSREIFTSKLEKRKALHLLEMGQLKVLLPYFISSHSIKALAISFNKSVAKENKVKHFFTNVSIKHSIITSVSQTCNNKACTWGNSASLGCHEHQHDSCHPSEIWRNYTRKFKKYEASTWRAQDNWKIFARNCKRQVRILQGNLLPLCEGIHHHLFGPSRGTYWYHHLSSQ